MDTLQIEIDFQNAIDFAQNESEDNESIMLSSEFIVH